MLRSPADCSVLFNPALHTSPLLSKPAALHPHHVSPQAASLAFNTSITLEPAFSPYSSDITFLHGAFIFEDVGATAYAVS